MLFGEKFRGCHHCGLTAVFNGANCGKCSNDGFAGTNVALNQSQHRYVALEICQCFEYDATLGVGEPKGKIVSQRSAQPVFPRQR